LRTITFLLIESNHAFLTLQFVKKTDRFIDYREDCLIVFKVILQVKSSGYSVLPLFFYMA
jgi:hypothetical protein